MAIQLEQDWDAEWPNTPHLRNKTAYPPFSPSACPPHSICFSFQKSVAITPPTPYCCSCCFNNP